MTTQHLLIIEDDARLAGMVREYLSQSGFEVTHMLDGESGLAAVQDKLPDLVILDLMLPDIDGLQVCRRLRSLSGEAARVPVLDFRLVRMAARTSDLSPPSASATSLACSAAWRRARPVAVEAAAARPA